MYPYHPQGYPPGPPPPRWGPPQGAPPPAWHLHPPGMAVPPPNVPPPPGTALPPPVYAPPPTSYYGSYPPPPDPAVSAPTPAAVLTPVPAAVPADVPCNPPYPTVTVPQQQEQQMDTIRKANGEVPSFDEYLDFKKLLSRKEWKHLFGRDPTFKEYIEFYDRKEAINWMAVCGTVPTFEDYMEFLVERDSRDWVAFCQVIPTFKDFIDHIQKNASFDFKAECGLKPRFKDFMMYYKVIKKSKDWASLYKRQVTYVDFLSFTKQAQDKEWHDISPLRGSPKFEDFLDYTLECESRNWEKEYGSAPTFTEFVQVRELNEPGNLERFQGLEPRLEHLMEFKEHKKSRDWHEFCERLPSLEDFLAYLSHQSSPHWMTLADKYNDKPFFTDYMKFLQIRASKDWQALRGADPTFANFIEYLCRRQARDWKAVLGHVPSFHDFIEYVDHSASDEWKALGDAMPSFLAFMGYKLGVRIKDATTAREERFELDSWDKRVYRSRSRSRSRKRTFSRSTSPYGKRPRHRSRERSNDRHGDRARHRRSRSRSREGRNRYRRSRSRGYSPYRSGSRRHSNERSGRHHSGSRRSRSRSRGGRRSPAEAYDPFAPSLSSPPRGGGGRRRSEHMYDDISNSSFPDDRRHDKRPSPAADSPWPHDDSTAPQSRDSVDRRDVLWPHELSSAAATSTRRLTPTVVASYGAPSGSRHSRRSPSSSSDTYTSHSGSSHIRDQKATAKVALPDDLRVVITKKRQERNVVVEKREPERTVVKSGIADDVFYNADLYTSRKEATEVARGPVPKIDKPFELIGSERVKRSHVIRVIETMDDMMSLVEESHVCDYDVLKLRAMPPDFLLKCFLCDDRDDVYCKGIDELKAHREREHGIAPADYSRYTCCECGHEASPAGLAEHLRDEHGLGVNIVKVRKYLVTTDMQAFSQEAAQEYKRRHLGTEKMKTTKGKGQKESEDSKGPKISLSIYQVNKYVKNSGNTDYDLLSKDTSRRMHCFLCKKSPEFRSLIPFQKHVDREHNVVIKNFEQYIRFSCFACRQYVSSAHDMVLHLMDQHNFDVELDVVKEYLVVSDIKRCKDQMRQSSAQRESKRRKSKERESSSERETERHASGARKRKKSRSAERDTEKSRYSARVRRKESSGEREKSEERSSARETDRRRSSERYRRRSTDKSRDRRSSDRDKRRYSDRDKRSDGDKRSSDRGKSRYSDRDKRRFTERERDKERASRRDKEKARERGRGGSEEKGRYRSSHIGSSDKDDSAKKGNESAIKSSLLTSLKGAHIRTETEVLHLVKASGFKDYDCVLQERGPVEGDFICPIATCTTSRQNPFVSSRHLKNHLRFTHGKHQEQVYKCFVCGEQIAVATALHYHLHREHRITIGRDLVAKCLVVSEPWLLEAFRPKETEKRRGRSSSSDSSSSSRERRKGKSDTPKDASGGKESPEASGTEPKGLESYTQKGALLKVLKEKKDKGYDIFKVNREKLSLPCEKCWVKFHGLSDLKEHAKVAHAHSVSTYKCFKCAYESVQPGQMLIHARHTHNLVLDLELVKECLGCTNLEAIISKKQPGGRNTGAIRTCEIPLPVAVNSDDSGVVKKAATDGSRSQTATGGKDEREQLIELVKHAKMIDYDVLKPASLSLRCPYCSSKPSAAGPPQSYFVGAPGMAVLRKHLLGQHNKSFTSYTCVCGYSNSILNSRKLIVQDMVQHLQRIHGLSFAPVVVEECLAVTDTKRLDMMLSGSPPASEPTRATLISDYGDDSEHADDKKQAEGGGRTETGNMSQPNERVAETGASQIPPQLAAEVTKSTNIQVGSISSTTEDEANGVKSSQAAPQSAGIPVQRRIGVAVPAKTDPSGNTSAKRVQQRIFEKKMLLSCIETSTIPVKDFDILRYPSIVPCRLCPALWLTDMYSHQEHQQKVHHSKVHKLFRCFVCGDTFAEDKLVLKHLLEHGVVVKPFLMPCLAVSQMDGQTTISSRDEMQAALTMATVTGYDILRPAGDMFKETQTCPICEEETTLKGLMGLKEHAKEQHADCLSRMVKERFKCFMCGAENDTASDLKEHLLARHVVSVPESLVQSHLVVTDMNALRSGGNKMRAVSKARSEDEKKWLKHSESLDTVHDANKYDKVFTANDFEELKKLLPSTVGNQDSYDCQKSPSVMRKVKMPCPYCSSEKCGLVGLKAHIKAVHNLENLEYFKCCVCGLESGYPGYMFYHIRTVHGVFVAMSLISKALQVTDSKLCIKKKDEESSSDEEEGGDGEQQQSEEVQAPGAQEVQAPRESPGSDDTTKATTEIQMDAEIECLKEQLGLVISTGESDGVSCKEGSGGDVRTARGQQEQVSRESDEGNANDKVEGEVSKDGGGGGGMASGEVINKGASDSSLTPDHGVCVAETGEGGTHARGDITRQVLSDHAAAQVRDQAEVGQGRATASQAVDQPSLDDIDVQFSTEPSSPSEGSLRTRSTYVGEEESCTNTASASESEETWDTPASTSVDSKMLTSDVEEGASVTAVTVSDFDAFSRTGESSACDSEEHFCSEEPSSSPCKASETVVRKLPWTHENITVHVTKESQSNSEASSDSMGAWSDKQKPQPNIDTWSDKQKPQPNIDVWSEKQKPQPNIDTWSDKQKPQPNIDTCSDKEHTQPDLATASDKEEQSLQTARAEAVSEDQSQYITEAQSQETARTRAEVVIEDQSQQTARSEVVIEDQSQETAFIEEVIEDQLQQAAHTEVVIDDQPQEIARIRTEVVIEDKPQQTARTEVVIENQAQETSRTEVVTEDQPQQTAHTKVVIEDKPQQTARTEVVIEDKPQQTARTEVVIENQTQETARTRAEVVTEDQPQQTARTEVVIEDQSQQTARAEAVIEDQSHQTARAEAVIEDQSHQTTRTEVVIEDQSQETAITEAVIEDQSQQTAHTEAIIEDQSHQTTRTEVSIEDQSQETAITEAVIEDQSQQTARTVVVSEYESDSAISTEAVIEGRTVSTEVVVEGQSHQAPTGAGAENECTP